MGSEEVQSVVVLIPWQFTQKQIMRKPWVQQRPAAERIALSGM